MNSRVALTLLVCCAVSACTLLLRPHGSTEADSDVASHVDADADVDGDVDGDADADADVEGDGDVEDDGEVVEVVIAEDTFESGDTSGGSGWMRNWYTEFDVTVTTEGGPHAASYHMRLVGRPNAAYVSRSVDITGRSGVHLQFWAWLDDPASGETVPVNFTWSSGSTRLTEISATASYQYYDFDLSSYPMTTGSSTDFWYRSDTAGAFYLDDIRFVVP